MIFLWLLGMVVRVGINGFGRIGRVIFRTCVQSKDLEVSAINDPAVDIEYICYLIKFDSTHGKFKGDVSYSADNEICIDDKKIKVFSEKLPSNIPWHSAAVQYVVEASGMFTNFEKASAHLASEGVQRVIVTAPTIDVPMLILGVNNEQINTEQKVISSASSTLYCLAPIVKILEDNYGIAEGFITSIHAMTPSLKPLDGLCLKGKHWRDHRSIHQNIIPAATGACRALGKVIPSVRDKLTGLAFRVPIVNVSVLDITVRLNKNTTIQDIIKRVEAESVSKMKNIIKISRDQEVSSDFMGDETSCIFDVNSSLQLNPKFFKLICWYENEHSYACRVLDSIKYSEEICKLELMSKIPIGSIISTDHKKPIPNFNKEYTIAKCLIRNNSKLLLRTSQEIDLDAKSQERQITFKRPSLYHNSGSNQLALCETKLSNDIFNGCNDEVQSRALVKENKNLSFQDFVSLRPSYVESNNFHKTKEHLEEVKQEFSKMVNITENLLMKSNKSKLNILEEEIENNVGKKDTKQEFCNTRFTLPIVSKSIPTSRVFQTSFSKLCKDVFKMHKKENSNIEMIKNTNNLDDTRMLDYNRLNQHIESKSTEICVNSKILDSKLLVKCQSESHDSEKNKENVSSSKANDGLVNLQSLRLENTICNLEKTLCATRVGNKNIKPKVTVSVGFKTDLGSSNLEMVTTISKHNIKYDDVKNNSDIILVNKDNKNPNTSDLNCKELNVAYIKPESSEPEKNNMNNRTEIRKKIIQGIIKILTADAMEDKTRNPTLVNKNTTRSDRAVNKTADIYDKLDSASSTDSENSFEINERKSQVIDVTDLNSSAEDLARLDKICRIIEISDEMSDKLFSALGNNDKNINKKKWSFKDLCERLKLDEFCNDVFG